MMGEDVVVFNKVETGRDDCDEPVYEWVPERVTNVLVAPSSDETQGEMADMRPERARARYRLAFPKTYLGDLMGARVALVDRGMPEDADEALRVMGAPDRVSPCPTKWNLIADVERVYG